MGRRPWVELRKFGGCGNPAQWETLPGGELASRDVPEEL